MYTQQEQERHQNSTSFSVRVCFSSINISSNNLLKTLLSFLRSVHNARTRNVSDSNPFFSALLWNSLSFRAHNFNTSVVDRAKNTRVSTLRPVSKNRERFGFYVHFLRVLVQPPSQRRTLERLRASEEWRAAGRERAGEDTA